MTQPKTKSPCLTDLIKKAEIAFRIFQQLPNAQLAECSLVSYDWHMAVRAYRGPQRVFLLNHDVQRKQTRAGGKSIKKMIEEDYKFASVLKVEGWSSSLKGNSHFVDQDGYEALLSAKTRARSLILKGRGKYVACKCRRLNDVHGSSSKLQDPVESHELTQLVTITVGETFTISSCALLDLMARSPKLKAVKFCGIIEHPEHSAMFTSRRFHCDLERLYWPFPRKNDKSTIKTIMKRNENLDVVHSSTKIVCDALAGDLLPKVRYLSLNLLENWNLSAKHLKKTYEYSKSLAYLRQARSVEALEVRTFDRDESEDSAQEANMQKLFEQYKNTFWKEVSNMSKLRYMGVYGAWEFVSVCQQIEKNGLGVQYFKTNLPPESVTSAVDDGDDNPTLSMADGCRALRRLINMGSISLICIDKLKTIELETSAALKELADRLWLLDIKTNVTEEVEDLVNQLLKRGNQLGKTYRLHLHVQPSNGQYADLLIPRIIKHSSTRSVRAEMTQIAETAIKDIGRAACGLGDFHMWGLQLVDNVRDKATFQRQKADWAHFEEKFDSTLQSV